MKRILLSSLLVLLTVGCSAIRPAIPPTPLGEFIPELEVHSKWVAQLDKGVGEHYLRLTPLQSGDHVYGANRAGLIAAFRYEDGEPVWRQELDARISAGPADGGGLLLLGGKAEVVAISKHDGSKKWRSEVSSEVLSPPLLAGGKVIVKTLDGGLFALDASTGKQLWHYKQKVPTLSLRGSSRPVVVGGIIVIGFADGHVAALDLENGKLRWQATISVARGRTELERMVDIDASIVVVDGIVYVAGYQGRVAALTLANGRLLWSREISSYSGLAFADDVLYVGDAEGDIWALSIHNGGTLWKQGALRGRSPSAPAVQGNYLVAGDYEGYLHWFAREDGHLVARIRIEDWDTLFPVKDASPENDYKEDRGVIGTPVVVGDRILVMDKRGVLGLFVVSPKGTN